MTATAHSLASAASAAPFTKELLLGLAPSARFGTGGLPNAPQRPVVLLAESVSALDVPLLRRLARAIGYELHLGSSAIAAPGTVRNAGWFTPENCSDGATETATNEARKHKGLKTLRLAA